MIKTINLMLAPVRQRLANMVARAVVKQIDDGKKMQLLQLQILNGELKDGVERPQNYGFTSVPEDGAEAVVVCVNGKRDHTVAIVVEDRRYRVKGLQPGEVAMFDKNGSKVVMKANGDIEITPKSGQKLKIMADVEITGALDVSGAGTIGDGLDVTGDVDSSGTVTGSTDVVGGGKSLKDHQHSVAGAVTAAPGDVTFVPAAKTGPPS